MCLFAQTCPMCLRIEDTTSSTHMLGTVPEPWYTPVTPLPHPCHTRATPLSHPCHTRQVVTSSVMRYRVLRCAPRLPVAPLLGLGVGVSPCPTHLASYLLRLDASGGQVRGTARLSVARFTVG
jgi:hypothetical protein